MTMLVEDGDTYEELRGVTLIGKGEIVEEPDRIWELGVSVFSRYNAPYTEEMKPFVELMLNKRVVVKMNVERVDLLGPPQARRLLLARPSTRRGSIDALRRAPSTSEPPFGPRRWAPDGESGSDAGRRWR